jgi:hypothetical protein
MRILKIWSIVLLLMNTSSRAQTLKGSWVTNANEQLFISDTTGSHFDNYFSVPRLHDEYFRLFNVGDTLSFRNSYTSSRTNFKVQHVDRYDLKIIKFTDSLLVVSPASDFSKNYFGNQQQLRFRRQDHIIDTTLHFEKIVFHTTQCYGTCNVYHLQVEQSGAFKLHRAFMYDHETYYRDSTAEGYFTGQLPDSLYQPLLHALRTINLRSLNMDTVLCCDAPVKTVIVYFNGQRKYFKTMFPPRFTDRLILALYNICGYANGSRVNEPFKLEE